MNGQSQGERILDYLKSGKSLTVVKALKEFGCYALSQRVGELRRAGHPIESTMVRRGRKCWAQYRLS